MISVNIDTILPQATAKPNKIPKDIIQHCMPLIDIF